MFLQADTDTHGHHEEHTFQSPENPLVLQLQKIGLLLIPTQNTRKAHSAATRMSNIYRIMDATSKEKAK